jgi:hypothetical protein
MKELIWPSSEKILVSGIFLAIVSYSTPSLAVISQIYSYVNKYQIGLDYSNSTDRVALSYDAAVTGGVPDTCQVMEGDSSRQRCQADMFGGGSSGWGVFLQPAFKKQGFFYGSWDVSFGARYLSGELPTKQRNKPGLLLRSASFSLGAIVMKPYVEFGITPDRFPDILFSLGPAVQVACGTVNLNDQPEEVLVGTSSVTGPMSIIHGFFAMEVVVKRFGEGAFSFMLSRDVTGSGRGTKIYPKNIDGMSDIRGAFSRQIGGMAFGFGLKLLTPWP